LNTSYSSVLQPPSARLSRVCVSSVLKRNPLWGRDTHGPYHVDGIGRPFRVVAEWSPFGSASRDSTALAGLPSRPQLFTICFSGASSTRGNESIPSSRPPWLRISRLRRLTATQQSALLARAKCLLHSSNSPRESMERVFDAWPSFCFMSASPRRTDRDGIATRHASREPSPARSCSFSRSCRWSFIDRLANLMIRFLTLSRPVLGAAPWPIVVLSFRWELLCAPAELGRRDLSRASCRYLR